MLNIVGAVLKKVFGTKQQRDMRRYTPMVDAINSLEEWAQGLSDGELTQQTDIFRQRLQDGETLEDLIPESFAVVREAGKRVLNMRHFDVQLVGGIALFEGKIAEMTTGEGKTLVSTLPAYLRGLSGKGVHIVTVNDYLARRDREWMGPLHEFLGLSVGVIQHDMDPPSRQKAYGCDITYGTNNEYGFDYLRDNMAIAKEYCVQRELYYGIVDEVDSILIDEARTPLIISGPSDQNTQKYIIVDKVVRKLKRDEHFTVDEKDQVVTLTEKGSDHVQELLNVNMYDERNLDLVHHINQALKAHHLFKLDDRYMVEDGEVIIVDEFTGRKMPGRRFSDGLHQALEAKEGLKIQRETQTMATITFQNYFRLYKTLAGMTGTAATEANEFSEIYRLDVVEIPTNRPMVRQDNPDVVYKTEQEKYKAIADEIVAMNKEGRPVLVGTVSIEKSEKISAILKKHGVKHNVLNAKHHEQEAQIVAEAGQNGAVTIATNMAGRGTDIKLGEGVVELGGLHIVGTERHESRRIDNQLRGRSGRQGDPGSTRFFLSLDDDLMRIFGGERIKALADRFGMEEGEVLEHKMISRAIENAQKRVEAHHFDMRKHILKYDDVMNKQREAIYTVRHDLLIGEHQQEHLWEMCEAVIEEVINTTINDTRDEETWELENLRNQVRQFFNIQIPEQEDPAEFLGLEVGQRHDDFVASLTKAVRQKFDERMEKFGPDLSSQIMSYIMLRTIDVKWKDHLLNMDHLRDAVGLRGYGQKDPLQEYQREGFEMFGQMYHAIQQQCVGHWFHVEVEVNAPAPRLQQDPQQQMVETRGDDGSGAQQPRQQPKPVTVVNQKEKVGRNDPCPCGSGKKYKKCCMLNEQGAA